MVNKLQQEIENLKKEIESIKPYTPHFSMNIANGDIATWISEDYPKKLKQIELQTKLSQTKKCIEIFKEMIDSCKCWGGSGKDRLINVRDLKSQLDEEKDGN